MPTSSKTQSTKCDLLKAPEAAAALSISLRTLWYLAKAGDLRPLHIRGSTRWARSDILAYIEGLRTGKTCTKRRRTSNDAA